MWLCEQRFVYIKTDRLAVGGSNRDPNVRVLEKDDVDVIGGGIVGSTQRRHQANLVLSVVELLNIHILLMDLHRG